MVRACFVFTSRLHIEQLFNHLVACLGDEAAMVAERGLIDVAALAEGTDGGDRLAHLVDKGAAISS